MRGRRRGVLGREPTGSTVTWNSAEENIATGSILITGNLISAEDAGRIEAAGFSVVVLSEAPKTDAGLAEALLGKAGYICADHERISEGVIAACPDLRVISFPGSGFVEFIPGWRFATSQGIAVCAAVGANAPSVAEYALLLALAMVRDVSSHVFGGQVAPKPARELGGLNLGIVGLGHSGRALAERAACLGMTVRAAVRTPPADAPARVEVLPLADVLSSSDVLSIHVSRSHGRAVLMAPELARMPDGAILINVAFPDAVDWSALRRELISGRLRAAYDAPPDGTYRDLPAQSFIASAAQAAYDTLESNRRVGRLAVEALLGVLVNGTHERVVNPDFMKSRRPIR